MRSGPLENTPNAGSGDCRKSDSRARIRGRDVVLIVDRCAPDRTRLQSELRAAAALSVVAISSISELPPFEPLNPRIVVVALRSQRGLTVLRHLRALYPAAKAVVIGALTIPTVCAADRLGAHAFLAEPVSAGRILAVLGAFDEKIGSRRARPREETPVSSAAVIRQSIPSENSLAVALIQGVASEFSLTAREAEILAAASRGKSTKEIAAELCISRKTAEYFWARLYDKLGCHSQLEALALLVDRALWSSRTQDLPRLR